MFLIEMEMVTSEVELVRAALRLRAREVPAGVAQEYERIAESMRPVGLYQFDPADAGYICLALKDFSDISKAIGKSKLAARTDDLLDNFLRESLAVMPVEESGLSTRHESSRKKALPMKPEQLELFPELPFRSASASTTCAHCEHIIGVRFQNRNLFFCAIQRGGRYGKKIRKHAPSCRDFSAAHSPFIRHIDGYYGGTFSPGIFRGNHIPREEVE